MTQKPINENTIEENLDGQGQTPTLLYTQNFESFSLSGNWFLSDFNLQGEKDKTLYTQDDQLKFDIRWTKRTRHHLADKLNYPRKEMNHQLANSLCEPKIEIGKERVYTNSESKNLIAELDTDLKHCGMNGVEPAAISLRSFVPTQIGYKYNIKLKYMMRSYKSIHDKSYKNLIVRFGNTLEKFEPQFDNFTEISLDVVAMKKFSKLVIFDNGLPNSYGILIDDIVVSEYGKVDNYDACADLFSLNSKGFRKCIQGEVETSQTCELSDLSHSVVHASKVKNMSENRRDLNNIFTNSPPQNGSINLFSLGLKGKLKVSCAIDGHAALLPIEGKTLSLREISWGNANVSTYPELAKIRVKLEDCAEKSLNRTVTIATLQTGEDLSFTFDQDEEGRPFTGCKMNKLIIKDITPKGPSKDGIDINSLRIQ